MTFQTYIFYVIGAYVISITLVITVDQIKQNYPEQIKHIRNRIWKSKRVELGQKTEEATDAQKWFDEEKETGPGETFEWKETSEGWRERIEKEETVRT